PGAPFNFFADLGRLVSGVREYRYQDLAAVGASLHYRYQLFPWLRPGVFAVVGSAGADTPTALGDLRWGTGLQIELPFSRGEGWVPRWEVAVFNSEWIFQGGLEA